jgi:hypothetical protein
MIGALQVTLTWGDVLIVAAIAVLATIIVARLG